jgi:prolipoprotein diacylglyceryltransferase
LWENTGKIGNFWNSDAWSKIFTGKRRDHTTPLNSNQPLTLTHQLAISKFFIHHVKGFLFLRKSRKNG